MQLVVDPSLILSGHNEIPKTGIGVDFILLHDKFFVYRCRINNTKPLMQCFVREMKQVCNTNDYVHRTEMTYDKFGRNWLLYGALVEETN